MAYSLRIVFPVILIGLLLTLTSAIVIGQTPDKSAVSLSGCDCPPEKLDIPGLPNFYRVTPNLYRGGQPSTEGIKLLKIFGIKTIINLRPGTHDRDGLKDSGLEYEQINMHAWHPEKEDIIKIVKIIKDKDRGPFFVHCHYGSDRTGVAVAVYRILFCGWSKGKAIQEMANGGYGFHWIWSFINKHFVNNIDIAAINDASEIKSPQNNGSSGKKGPTSKKIKDKGK